MISNIDEKKINKKTIRMSNKRMKEITEYIKLNGIKDFSKFIDNLVERELNKEKTLFSV